MISISWAHQLRDDAIRLGSRVAARDDERLLTFADRAERACGLARRLLAAGVAPGEPVVCFLRNGVDVIWAADGISATGAAELVLDPGLGKNDLAYACSLANVRFVVTDESLADRFSQLDLTTIDIASIEPAPVNALSELPDFGSSHWGKLLLTSGTTGHPKGVVHSHERRWLASLMLRSNLPFEPGPDDRILLMTPYAHGAGLLTSAFLDAGSSVHLVHGVDPERVADLLERREVNCIFAPPTVLAKLASSLDGRRFDHMRCVFTGTATLTPDLYAAASEMFGATVRITYGMTEIFNPITSLQPSAVEKWYAGEAGQQSGSCLGWPAYGVTLRIVNEEDRDLAQGEVGEVLVRAPQMFLGYLMPDGFQPMGNHEFHRTGDMGYVDAQGRLFLTGRMRDVIKSGGYKIFPEEIERSLGANVTVLGYPSAYWGEIAVAVIENSAESWSPPDDVMNAMTGYKRPRAYLCVPEFPRNGQGKVLRSRLRDLIEASYEMEDGPYPRFTQSKTPATAQAIASTAGN